MLPVARYVAWLKLCGRLAPEASATSVLTREMRVLYSVYSQSAREVCILCILKRVFSIRARGVYSVYSEACILNPRERCVFDSVYNLVLSTT